MPDDAAVSGGEPDGPVDVVFLRPIQPASQVERIALVAGLVAGAVLAGLVGWLSVRTYEAQNREAQRALFVQTAQQEPQFVRMRVTVQKIGDVAKVSDVAFLS